MHEFGLMSSVVETACDSARQAGAVRITRVALVVGELTQAVDEAMRFAYDALVPGTLCEGAELAITFVPARSRCLDCGIEFEHDVYHRACPACGSPFTEIVAGRELLIDKIEIELPDE